MKDLILSKATSKGQKIEIVLTRYCNSATATAYVDGQCVSVHETPTELAKYYALCPEKVKRVPAGITHILGKVGLTASEAATVETALAESQSKINTEPKVLFQRLRQERERLVSSVQGWNEEAQSASDKAWDRGDEAGAFVGKAVTTARQQAEAASQELREFDAAHPEIKAAIERQRAEDAARRAQD